MNVELLGIEAIKNQLQKIQDGFETSKKLRVGIFGQNSGTVLQYAGIHEFGGVIKPKTGKFLAIPIRKELKGKSPREIQGLEFIPLKGSSPILAKIVNEKVTPYFLLKRSVTIPERSFLRSTINDKAKMEKALKKSNRQLMEVVEGKKNIEYWMNAFGLAIAAEIKNTINNGITPENSPLTAAMKGGTKPLYDSGRLINAIVHLVE